MTKLDNKYLQIIDAFNGDEAGRRATWQAMAEGTSKWDGKPTAISYVPRIFEAEMYEYLQKIAKTTHHILCKTIEKFREDPKFRNEYRLDKRVEELACLPILHDNLMPYGRVDFVVDEDNLRAKAVEFNTDCSGGMNEIVEACKALRQGNVLPKIEEFVKLDDCIETLFDGWVQKFINIFKRSGHFEPGMTIALTPCYDSPNPNITELDIYRRLFEKAGVDCSIFDVRELEYDGKALFGKQALSGDSNVKIDAVWRWTIVSDLLEYWDDVQPFVQCVHDCNVPIIGGFCSQIGHDKQTFAVLHKTAHDGWLSCEEIKFVEEVIPKTWFLDDSEIDFKEVFSNKNHYIIKPTDMYESKRVIAGKDCTSNEWEREVKSALAETRDAGVSKSNTQKAFILQEFNEPFLTPAIPLTGDEDDFVAEPSMYGNVLGLYLHDGEFVGVYNRQGPNSVISSAHAGICTPVLFAK